MHVRVFKRTILFVPTCIAFKRELKDDNVISLSRSFFCMRTFSKIARACSEAEHLSLVDFGKLPKFRHCNVAPEYSPLTFELPTTYSSSKGLYMYR